MQIIAAISKKKAWRGVHFYQNEGRKEGRFDQKEEQNEGRFS